MQTLSLALRNKGEEGEPLPTVFKQLDALGVKFRRGWLHLIGAAPGGGKSALMSFMSLVMRDDDNQPIPTLYFSADNDILTFSCAAGAVALQTHTTDIEERIEYGDPDVVDAIESFTKHLWINFDAAPTPQDIHEELLAFANVYGDWPHLIVVDNLMDVEGSSGGFENERTTQDGILNFLKVKARETKAATVVLCHVTGEHTNGTKPIPRDGLMNKIDKRPQVVLTMFQPTHTKIAISAVKNRRGRGRADGTHYTEIPWLPEMAWFGTEGSGGGYPEQEEV